MNKPSYHQQIINLPMLISEIGRGPTGLKHYREGHRDARHRASEIAKEADARIKELEGKLMNARTSLERLAGMYEKGAA